MDPLDEPLEPDSEPEPLEPEDPPDSEAGALALPLPLELLEPLEPQPAATTVKSRTALTRMAKNSLGFDVTALDGGISFLS